MAKKKLAVACLFLFTFITVASGIFLFFGFDYVLNKYIEQKLIIAPGSAIYQNWIDPSVPIHLRIYLFNCTNAEDVVTNTAKPILEELGPYIFREHRTKVNTKWFPNGTVAFNETRTWFFAPELSNGSLMDQVTSLNVPVVAAAYLVHNHDDLYNDAISESMTMFNEDVFATHSVGEWLFDGFSSPFIDLAMQMNWSVPYDKFGWFYQKNNSDDGRYSIFTGNNDINQLAKVDTWMGSRQLPYWTGKCKEITGGIGEIWPPYYNKLNSITLFNSDLKRSITLDYKCKEKFGSLDGHRYEANFKTLANSSINPSNKCYETKGKSYVSGIFDESGALNAPAYVSFPHFYLGDLTLTSGVIGLKPTKELHNTFVVIQPQTGVPMSVAARFQINILLEPLEGIKQFNNVKKVIMPILWLCETAQLDVATERQLHLLTKEIPFIIYVIAIAAVCMGGFFVLIISIILFLGPRKVQPEKRKSSNRQDYDVNVNYKSEYYADTKKMNNKF